MGSQAVRGWKKFPEWLCDLPPPTREVSHCTEGTKCPLDCSLRSSRRTKPALKDGWAEIIFSEKPGELFTTSRPLRAQSKAACFCQKTEVRQTALCADAAVRLLGTRSGGQKFPSFCFCQKTEARQTALCADATGSVFWVPALAGKSFPSFSGPSGRGCKKHRVWENERERLCSVSSGSPYR